MVSRSRLSSNPLRPGWYPLRLSDYQQYYRGDERGWAERYMLEIEARDPLRPPATKRAIGDIVVFAVLCVLAILAVATLIVTELL